jgi:tyrosyl-tRNA synthetase
MVVQYLKIFTRRSAEEIDDLARQTAEAPHLRAAQRALADDITDLVHSPAERRAAAAAAAAIFGREELAGLPEPTLRAVVAELGSPPLRVGEELPTVVEVLVAAGVVASRSAARRAIDEGGAYLNNRKVTDADARLVAEDLLHGRFVVVRRGRRTVGALAVER